MSQAELSQILTQLRTLAPTPTPAAPPVPSVAPVHHDSQVQYQSPVSVPPLPVPQSATYPTSYPPYANPSYPAVKLEAAPQPIPSTSSAPVAPSPAPAIPVNISSLFSSLVKSGVLSTSSTPQGTSNTADPKESTPAVDASQDYRSSILAIGIRLTSADIVKYVFNLIFVDFS